MAACEKCWADAFRAAMADPSMDQAAHYHLLLIKRNGEGPICTPREQAGQYWDEQRQCDTRDDPSNAKADPESGQAAG